MKTIAILILGFLVAGCLSAHCDERCKNYDINFDLKPELLLGEWYLISTTWTPPMNSTYNCLKFNVTALDERSSMVECLNQETNAVVGSSRLLTSRKVNSFIFFIKNQFRLLTIIDTDYSSYVLGVKCKCTSTGNVYNAFILSRTTTLSEETRLNLQNLASQKMNMNFVFNNIVYESLY